jgi:16S rRNA (adenine1518-N6/adenine1519-N6)-dimethyltransferase
MLPRAKKSFSQNWLVDESVVRKIIAAADIQSGEAVLEIGPGTGVLTEALVEAGAGVTAVEADGALIEGLREKFGDHIDLIEGDALNHSTTEPLNHSPYKLVSNIPYSISSDILNSFLTRTDKPTRLVLMVQREVADRIVAVPPKMSLLSVVCQLYAACSKVMNVPKRAFRPIPQVDSAVVLLETKPNLDQEQTIALAKQGFSSRRKQLHKNLSALPNIDSDAVKGWLTELGLDPRVRAENLTVDDWVRLTHMYHKFKAQNA